MSRTVVPGTTKVQIWRTNSGRVRDSGGVVYVIDRKTNYVFPVSNLYTTYLLRHHLNQTIRLEVLRPLTSLVLPSVLQYIGSGGDGYIYYYLLLSSFQYCGL